MFFAGTPYDGGLSFYSRVIDGKDEAKPVLIQNIRQVEFHRRRFFAGQPDPNDASHFSIDYEVEGEKGTIDGWLQDNDTVKMEVRDGPAKLP